MIPQGYALQHCKDTPSNSILTLLECISLWIIFKAPIGYVRQLQQEILTGT